MPIENDAGVSYCSNCKKLTDWAKDSMGEWCRECGVTGTLSDHQRHLRFAQKIAQNRIQKA